MRTTVNAGSVKCGDVIFVLNESKHARASVVVQTVLRLGDLLAGRRGIAAYSHVMLGISQGIVIHADGAEVTVESLRNALEDELDEVDRRRFRVVRPDQPGLSAADEQTLTVEAIGFLKEKYSFVLGRRSGWFGRLRHRNRHLTQPFCSELIATAYRAIDRPIGGRAADRTLPSDIDAFCIPPAWRDATDEYFEARPDVVIDDRIRVGDRTLTIAQFMIEGDALLQHGWDLNSAQTVAQHDVVNSIIAPAVFIQQAKGIELEVAKMVALRPTLLFGAHAMTTAADLSSIPAFYAQIRRGTVSDATPFADALTTARPDVAADQSAYEGVPPANRLRYLERLGDSLSFGAKALRLGAALQAIATGLGAPLKDPIYSDITSSMVQGLLHLVPPLSEAEAMPIRADIARLTMPPLTEPGTGPPAEDDTQWTRDVRDRCNRVVQLHLLVSILIHGSEQRRTPAPIAVVDDSCLPALPACPPDSDTHHVQ